MSFKHLTVRLKILFRTFEMKSSRKRNARVRLVLEQISGWSRIPGLNLSTPLNVCSFQHDRLQARLATKQAKPNGQFRLRVENVEEYFKCIPISDLPGVGYSTTQKCSHLGLKVCADLQGISLAKLQQDFGRKMGETLYQNCRGIDNKPLTYDQVSSHLTYFHEAQKTKLF